MTAQIYSQYLLQTPWVSDGSQLSFTDLLEARHDVTSDGADQGRDVIHEALREAVLPGRLQPLSEIQVVDDALHLRFRRDGTRHHRSNKAKKGL